jgi:HEAT repeat protein
VLTDSIAYMAFGLSLLAWCGLSLLVLVGRARHDVGAREQRHAVGPMRGSRAERALLRRAAARPHTELGKWRRIVALRELARIRHPACRTLLPAALTDTDDDVVGAAVRSLGDVDDGWAAGLLLGALRDGSHPRSRVASQLEHFAPRLLDELVELLDDEDAPVRYWAATLLARYEAAPVGHLVERVGDTDPNVRAVCIETLGVLKAKAARPRVVAALNDEEWIVRLHACRALGRMGIKADAAKMTRLLGDTEWWVRSAAKDALRALAPRSLPAVRAALDDPDEFARNGAAEILQDVGLVDELMESGADPALLERILRAGGPRLRSTAIDRDADVEHSGVAEAA